MTSSRRTAPLPATLWALTAALAAALTSAPMGVSAIELIFELEDGKSFCFYEETNNLEDKVYFDFQVVRGGNHDVDAVVKGPSDKNLYAAQKKDRGRWLGNVEKVGQFKFCFSNEFSSFTHKLIYFEIAVGKDITQPISRFDYNEAKKNKEERNKEAREQMYVLSDQLDTIKKSIQYMKVVSHTGKIREQIRRERMEDLFSNVNRGSGFVVFCIIVNALIGVVGVRRLFK